jgi:hypothetical protein
MQQLGFVSKSISIREFLRGTLNINPPVRD